MASRAKRSLFLLSTTIRLDEDFNEQLRIAMAKRRVKSLQEAVTMALRQWLAGAQPAAAAAPASSGAGQYPPAHREAHDLLEEILRAGTEEEKGWIVGNLRTFVAAIRARPVAARSKRAG
jgi:hypothetical protein